MRPCGLCGRGLETRTVEVRGDVRSGIDGGADKVAAANAVVRGERGEKDGAPELQLMATV